MLREGEVEEEEVGGLLSVLSAKLCCPSVLPDSRKTFCCVSSFLFSSPLVISLIGVLK